MSRVRPCTPSDAAALCAIYNPHVLHGIATFEQEPVGEAEMRRRIRERMRSHPWLVHESGGAVRGYAYAGPWNPRDAYRHTAECSVYVADDAQGRGVGEALYRALLERLAEASFHALVAAIALPNDASVALHEKLGFERAGTLREVGRKLDRWIDVGYWSRTLR